MSNLYQQVVSLYPELSGQVNLFANGTICLQDDSNGNGPYIARWGHPTLPEPTQEQLAAFTSTEPLQ
jgi:hypothetical protein